MGNPNIVLHLTIQLKVEVKRGLEVVLPHLPLSTPLETWLKKLRDMVQKQSETRLAKWFWKDRWQLLKELRKVLNDLEKLKRGDEAVFTLQKATLEEDSALMLAYGETITHRDWSGERKSFVSEPFLKPKDSNLPGHPQMMPFQSKLTVQGNFAAMHS